MALRLQADECVSTVVIRGLRNRGVDVLACADLGLLGASDTQHLERSISEDRIILTSDDDFLRLASHFQAQSKTFPGMIYFHVTTDVGTAVQRVHEIVTILDPIDMVNRVEFVT